MREGEPSPGWYDVSELDFDLVQQWEDLYEHCLSPNIYLSPDFVLTALDTFVPKSASLACIGSQGRLDALAILEYQRGRLTFPFPVYRLFKSIHSLQTGILIRTGIEDACLDAFMASLFQHSASSLYFEDFADSTAAAKRIQDSARRIGLNWHETYRYARAALRTDMTIGEWTETVPKKTRKEAARTRRRLEEIAPVSWRFVTSDEVDEQTIETFLSLEHESWKGDQGNSLLSDPEQAEFFRRVVRSLSAKGSVFFTELLLDDEVIASTVNFQSGETGFAFKVSSKKELAKYAPGILNEILFVQYVTDTEQQFLLMDSGATSGSFIEALWPDRMDMVSGYLLCGWRMKIMGAVFGAFRKFKKLMRTRSTNGF